MYMYMYLYFLRTNYVQAILDTIIMYLYLYFVFSEDQLCSGQSGDYHCKAATFTHEETSTHTLTVFGENILCVAILYLTST